MIVDILGCNSAGNCYLFKASSGETLIVDAGVSTTTVKKALDFNIAGVVGAIITHEHGDHAKGVKGLMKCGINVYSSKGTAEALPASHRLKILGAKTKIGGFTVLTFLVDHDANEPNGFVINHEECGNVLYLTDTKYVPYTFTGLSTLFIECNYSEKILNASLRGKSTIPYVANRVRNSHLSLAGCKQILSNAELEKVGKIILIHLSDTNSNDELFKNEITALTGKQVICATKGIKIEI